MKHDLLVQAEGCLLERLVQRALDGGAEFSRIERTDVRCMHLTCDERSAGILGGLCKKYGLKYRVLRRGGFAALRAAMRRRWTLLPGIMLCIMICALFLSRIWIIDIAFTGSAAGDAAKIAMHLRQNGIHIGMPVRRINPDMLQKQLAASTGDYSFIGVRRQGVRLLVEASPEIPAPQTHAIHQARDLVAARSGVVQEITVYSGEACVKPGDTVLAGDLLIRGLETTARDETTPVSALGRVIARCWYEGCAQSALRTEEYVRTGERRSACRLRLGRLDLPITQCAAYPSGETETEILPIGGLFLPLEMERTIHWKTEKRMHSTNEARLADLLQRLAQADAQSMLASDGLQYETAAHWLDTEKSENILRIRAVYEIYTDIAVPRDARIEEVY